MQAASSNLVWGCCILQHQAAINWERRCVPSINPVGETLRKELMGETEHKDRVSLIAFLLWIMVCLPGFRWNKRRKCSNRWGGVLGVRVFGSSGVWKKKKTKSSVVTGTCPRELNFVQTRSKNKVKMVGWNLPQRAGYFVTGWKEDCTAVGCVERGGEGGGIGFLLTL